MKTVLLYQSISFTLFVLSSELVPFAVLPSTSGIVKPKRMFIFLFIRRWATPSSRLYMVQHWKATRRVVGVSKWRSRPPPPESPATPSPPSPYAVTAGRGTVRCTHRGKTNRRPPLTNKNGAEIIERWGFFIYILNIFFSKMFWINSTSKEKTGLHPLLIPPFHWPSLCSSSFVVILFLSMKIVY